MQNAGLHCHRFELCWHIQEWRPLEHLTGQRSFALTCCKPGGAWSVHRVCNVHWQFASEPQSFMPPVKLDFTQDVWQACNTLKRSPLNLRLCRTLHSDISLQDALWKAENGSREKTDAQDERWTENRWSIYTHGEQILKEPEPHEFLGLC